MIDSHAGDGRRNARSAADFFAVPQRTGHERLKLLDIERLFDVIERTIPHRFDGRSDRGERRDHHDLSIDAFARPACG